MEIRHSLLFQRCQRCLNFAGVVYTARFSKNVYTVVLHQLNNCSVTVRVDRHSAPYVSRSGGSTLSLSLSTAAWYAGSAHAGWKASIQDWTVGKAPRAAVKSIVSADYFPPKVRGIMAIHKYKASRSNDSSPVLCLKM